MNRLRPILVPMIAVLALVAPTAARAGAGVIATVPGGGAPVGAAYNSANGRVYVGNYLAGSMQVIDAATNTTMGAPTFVGGCPVPVAVGPSNRVYLGDWCSGVLHVLDGTTLQNTPVPIPGFAGALAVDEAAGKVYVAPLFGSTIQIIDDTTGAPIGSIPMPFETSYGAAVHGGTLYLTALNASAVYISNGTTITGSIPIPGSYPQGLAVDRVNGRLFVTSYTGLHVVDLATNVVTQTLPSNACRWGAASNPLTGRLYVSDYCSGQMTVYDGVPLAPIQSVSLPVSQYFSTTAGDRFRVFATSSFSPPEVINVLTEDDVAPTAAFTTPSGTVLRAAVVIHDSVTGTASDDYSGVASVNVTFTHSLLGTSETVAATVTCATPRRLSCSWSAAVPLIPGPYTAAISGGGDRAGTAMSPGGSIAITVI